MAGTRTLRETSDLNAKHLIDASPMPSNVSPTSKNMPPKTPWRLRLQISGDHHTTIGMEVKEQILIGRAEPKTNWMPDLDLTNYSSPQAGISRRHALILREADGLFLQDLYSRNKTRLNGYILDPERSYRLRDGDDVAFSTLHIVFRFIKTPIMR